jgi:hypothetical protein
MQSRSGGRLNDPAGVARCHFLVLSRFDQRNLVGSEHPEMYPAERLIVCALLVAERAP